MQAAMEGGKATGNGEDIDIAGLKKARKVESYRNNLIGEGQRVPPTPLSFLTRLARRSARGHRLVNAEHTNSGRARIYDSHGEDDPASP